MDTVLYKISLYTYYTPLAQSAWGKPCAVFIII
jgi:hypothetical protein